MQEYAAQRSIASKFLQRRPNVANSGFPCSPVQPWAD